MYRLIYLNVEYIYEIYNIYIYTILATTIGYFDNRHNSQGCVWLCGYVDTWICGCVTVIYSNA